VQAVVLARKTWKGTAFASFCELEGHVLAGVLGYWGAGVLEVRPF